MDMDKICHPYGEIPTKDLPKINSVIDEFPII